MKSRMPAVIIASVIAVTAANARELTATEKNVIATALAKGFLDPQSAQFTWTPWGEPAAGDRTIYYCGTVNAKGADGKYGGYVPYLAAVFLKSGKITDAVLIGTNFPSPARRGSPMRQCMGRV
jgi:hypothetical protein